LFVQRGVEDESSPYSKLEELQEGISQFGESRLDYYEREWLIKAQKALKGE
jgi:hypothetical protein